MSKITTYEGANYTGRSMEFTSDNVRLQHDGFNDKPSSCKVESGTWILYKDSNFQEDLTSIRHLLLYPDPKLKVRFHF